MASFSISFTNHAISSTSSFHDTITNRITSGLRPLFTPIKAAAAEGESNSTSTAQTSKKEDKSTDKPITPVKRPQKPVYSMKKGQIVRVDKEKYLNSVNYMSVGHPPYYKGLDYIYEDRGEVLDLRNFETGEHALVAWVGVPTSPAWLPTEMLIKSEKLVYERM